MKDYYKILGIKETASGENIRARWIELMREFHPDGKRKGEVEDWRLKEINEAYGVLKHPSTRVEYDLRRAYHRKKRRLYLQRVVTPPAILIILGILGLIYLKKPRVVPQSGSTSPSARGSIETKLNHPRPPLPDEPKGLKAPEDSTIPKDLKAHETSPPVLKSEISTPTRKSPSSTPKGPKSLVTQGDKSGPVAHPSTAGDLPTATKKRPARKKPLTPIPKSETSANVQEASPKPIAKGSQIKREELPEPKPLEDLTDPNDMDKRNEPSHIKVTHLLIAPSSSIGIEKQMAQRKSASLIATEEEVKQFFKLYIESYTKKDIDGFHSLFSSKAVQNEKHGFNEIRKIYSGFFDQSQELRYHMEDARIEIYQNAVHVKARYRVNQQLKKGKEKKVWTGDIRWILVRENGPLKIRYLHYKQQDPRHSRTKASVGPQSATYVEERR